MRPVGAAAPTSGNESMKSITSCRPRRANSTGPAGGGPRAGRRRLWPSGRTLGERAGPASAPRVFQAGGGRGLDGAAPRESRRARDGGGAIALRVALAQQPEGVLVEPEPDVQAVLL